MKAGDVFLLSVFVMIFIYFGGLFIWEGLFKKRKRD